MPLKLDKLPDREAAKITFTASPELKAALNDYTEIYRRTYVQKESIAALIPFMLESFMNADPGFRRARKQLEEADTSPPPIACKAAGSEGSASSRTSMPGVNPAPPPGQLYLVESVR